jgi:hypothetical protein
MLCSIFSTFRIPPGTPGVSQKRCAPRVGLDSNREGSRQADSGTPRFAAGLVHFEKKAVRIYHELNRQMPEIERTQFDMRTTFIDSESGFCGSTWTARTERIVQWRNGLAYLKYRTIWIDVRKLDAILQQVEPHNYVGFRGQNGIDGKYAGFEEFMTSGKPVSMPTLARNEGGNISLYNGRHRFAWMRDHGARALPVNTPPKDATEIRRVVGTKVRVCRVWM